MLSAGSQTVLPTVRFSPATTVSFTAAANTCGRAPACASTARPRSRSEQHRPRRACRFDHRPSRPDARRERQDLKVPFPVRRHGGTDNPARLSHRFPAGGVRLRDDAEAGASVAGDGGTGRQEPGTRHELGSAQQDATAENATAMTMAGKQVGTFIGSSPCFARAASSSGRSIPALRLIRPRVRTARGSQYLAILARHHHPHRWLIAQRDVTTKGRHVRVNGADS
jgi:hypothetical protein